MIVKVQIIKGNGGWFFFDKVDSVTIDNKVEKDPEDQPYEYKDIRLFRDKLAFNHITVGKGQQAYLLTDEGKTIERIN